MLKAYRQHAAERDVLGIPPLPLNAEQTTELCEQLQQPPEAEKEYLMELLTQRIPPGLMRPPMLKPGF